MMFCKRGSRNATVFPVPVLAWASLDTLSITRDVPVEGGDLHIDTVQELGDCHALNWGESLQLHILDECLDEGCIHQVPITELLKLRDGRIWTAVRRGIVIRQRGIDLT